jgi:hypothetical protein
VAELKSVADGLGQYEQTVEVPGATFTIAYGPGGPEGTAVTAIWGDSAGYVESAVCQASENHCVTHNLPGATNCYINGIDHNSDIVYT